MLATVTSRLRSGVWVGAVLRAAAAACAVVIVAGIAFRLHFNLSTAGSLLLLLDLVITLRWGFAQATWASLIAAGALNFLFTQPLFTFYVADRESVVALIAFEACSLAVSWLAAKVREHGSRAETQRVRTEKLYQLSTAVLLTDDQRPVGDQLVCLLQELMGAGAVMLWNAHSATASRAGGRAGDEDEARWAFIKGSDMDDASNRSSHRLLRLGNSSIGALVLRNWNFDPLMANAVASLCAIALERARSLDRETRALAGRQTEQMRTTVLDGLAHAFKTPLTAIQTASSGLLEMGRLTLPQLDLVLLIDEESARLTSLTTRLLQTASLDSGQIRLQRSELSLASLLDEIVHSSEIPALGRVRLSLPEVQPIVDADSQMVRLAVTQLLDNALKYSSVGTPVEVTVNNDEFEALISVTNEGPFIPLQDRQRIFDRFQRGAGGEHRPPGTGIGLSIVKKTAEAHHGRVWVECEDGKTTFRFALPSTKKEGRRK